MSQSFPDLYLVVKMLHHNSPERSRRAELACLSPKSARTFTLSLAWRPKTGPPFRQLGQRIESWSGDTILIKTEHRTMKSSLRSHRLAKLRAVNKKRLSMSPILPQHSQIHRPVATQSRARRRLQDFAPPVFALYLHLVDLLHPQHLRNRRVRLSGLLLARLSPKQ